MAQIVLHGARTALRPPQVCGEDLDISSTDLIFFHNKSATNVGMGLFYRADPDSYRDRFEYDLPRRVIGRSSQRSMRSDIIFAPPRRFSCAQGHLLSPFHRGGVVVVRSPACPRRITNPAPALSEPGLGCGNFDAFSAVRQDCSCRASLRRSSNRVTNPSHMTGSKTGMPDFSSRAGAI